MGSRWLFACVLGSLGIALLLLLRTPRVRGPEAAVAPTAGSAAREGADVLAPEARPARVESAERSPAERAPAEAKPAAPGSGGWLRGRLTSALPFAWRGYRIGVSVAVEPTGEPEALARALARARPTLAPVGDDGRFELGPVTAGLVTVYLHGPGNALWRSTGHGEGDRQGIAQVRIEDGVVHERDIEVAELPGSLAVEARVNGVPAAGLEVELVRDLGGKLVGLTDANGRFGPVPSFAAGFRIQVADRDAGWKHLHPARVELAPGGRVLALVPIEVVRARVLFVARASGEPLARRQVAVLDAAGLPLIWGLATDDQGAAVLALPLGEYRFALNPGDTPQFAIGSSNRSAVVPWSYQGPLVARVSL
ncbi:MAG TPA: hypothetical protein VF530_15375 [Planctomycetota bacterium]